MKVLVVEDDAAVARATVRMLQFLRASAEEVRSVAEAEARISAGAAYDVVLADVGATASSGGSGRFTGWLRERAPGARLILTSGRPAPADFHSVPPERVFLQKPWGMPELRAALCLS